MKKTIKEYYEKITKKLQKTTNVTFSLQLTYIY